MSSNAELAARNKQFTLASWKNQSSWRPVSMSRADGVYFWDADGKRYIDWSSQLVNVNIGHNNQHVIKAIQEQAASLTYAMPSLATEPRAKLGEMLAEVTPAGLSKSFFTLGGADSIENAMKMARLYTGKQKIMTRYRAYHGGTFGAMSAGGDPRRLANEPGVPWIVRMQDPYAYRSSLYRGRTRDEGDQALVDQIEDTILFEGPDNIAAIFRFVASPVVADFIAFGPVTLIVAQRRYTWHPKGGPPAGRRSGLSEVLKQMFRKLNV